MFHRWYWCLYRDIKYKICFGSIFDCVGIVVYGSGEVNDKEMFACHLTELRLQTSHQEHIAKQAENMTLVLTVLVKAIANFSEKDNEQLQALVKDFQTEALQWRERVDLIRDGT